MAEQYNSNFTGPEIDAILNGSVRYDLAQSLPAAQQAQARGNIAAAPDGFGLGKNARMLTEANDLNNTYVGGWYGWFASVPKNAPASYCSMRVDSGPDTNYTIQTIFSPANKCLMQRTFVDGTWEVWEYINPPFTLGVEYRTTERYKGNAIYKKLDTDNVVKWSIDEGTTWKPESEYIGAANKETQDKVMATAMSTVRVTLSPAELPAYIAALPRLLDKYYEIKLTAGTCTQTLKFNGFYGLGYLMVIGADNLGSVFTGGVNVERTQAPVRLRGLSISGLISGSTVYVATATYLYLESCTVDCTGATYGLLLYDSTRASFNKCTISNCSTGKVLICGYNSIGVFSNCTMTNNKIGAWVYNGGIVLLSGSTPDTLGGSANEKGGGIIAKANGTLL